MTSDEALQQFIDSCIRRDLQEFYPDTVQAMKIAWKAALKWKETDGI